MSPCGLVLSFAEQKVPMGPSFSCEMQAYLAPPALVQGFPAAQRVAPSAPVPRVRDLSAYYLCARAGPRCATFGLRGAHCNSGFDVADDISFDGSL